MKIAEANSEDADSPQARALERDLEHLDDLRRFALPIIRDLANFPPAASWGDWLDHLESLAPRVLRHPERVLELFAELRPMAAVGPLTLAEVREVLTPRLSTLEREPPKHRYGRLFVCTPAQLRGRAFRVVFVTGLAERIFPQKSRQDPLLLDPLRRALDAPLDVEDDRVLHERLLLRLAVGAARERLYLVVSAHRHRAGAAARAVVLRARHHPRAHRFRPELRTLRAQHRAAIRRLARLARARRSRRCDR